MDAIDNLKPGDIVFYGDQQLQVLKPHAEVETHRLAVYSDGSTVRSMDQQDFRRRCHPLDVKAGGQFDFANGMKFTYLGTITTRERVARTMPVLFGGGELPIDKYRELRFRCLVDGDGDVYARLHDDLHGYVIDLTYSAVVPAQLAMPDLGDVSGFTRADLIAYVVLVNGEGKLSRDQIMEKVAALERKPWIRTSNSNYFKGVTEDDKGTIRHAAKGPRGRILYGLGDEGFKRAAKVVARLGEVPGRL